MTPVCYVELNNHWLALTLALVLAAGAAQLAAADSPVVPFKATYYMSPKVVGVDPNGCNIQQLPGVGQATHLGESTLYSDAVACPATLSQSGTLEFTEDNGDKLYGHFAGTLAFSYPNVSFTGDYWVDPPGTGRFEEVTGSGTYEGSAGLTTGKGIIYFQGILIK